MWGDDGGGGGGRPGRYARGPAGQTLARYPDPGDDPVRQAMFKSVQVREAMAARDAGAGAAYGADEEPLSSDDELYSANQEVIETKLRGDIFTAAFLMSVRGLRDGRICSMLMSWVWVGVGLALDAFLVYCCFTFIECFLVADVHADPLIINAAEKRLRAAIAGNITLGEGDGDILRLCYRLPSPYLFCVAEFMFACFLLGSLSETRLLFATIALCPRVRAPEKMAVETDERTTITGLRRCDKVWFTIGLIIPKWVFVAVLWYIGTAMLAFTKDVMHLVFRAIMLVCVVNADHVVYHALLSSSKRDWVERTNVLTVRPEFLRYCTAWPGELWKFGGLVASVWMSYVLFRHEFRVRTLCWECARDCANPCSGAFDFCNATEPFWWLNPGTSTRSDI